MKAYSGNFETLLLLDDSPEKTRLAESNHSILNPQNMSTDIEAILVSSDSNENMFYERIKKLWSDKKIIRIYNK
mgnify:CR=1 FL=1